jgi:hypothetical protein
MEVQLSSEYPKEVACCRFKRDPEAKWEWRRLTGRLVTEVVILRSLQDLAVQIDADISSYLSLKEEYSERLGNFLREAEEEYGDEDWYKQLSLDNLGKGGGRSKKKKGKKGGGSDEWIPFKGLQLSASVKGEAEIMFETIEAITEKLEALEEAKESIGELRNVSSRMAWWRRSSSNHLMLTQRGSLPTTKDSR